MVFVTLLTAAGVLLLLAEIFLVSGWSVAGIFGVISLVLSCICAFSEFGTASATIVSDVNVVLLVLLTVAAVMVKIRRKLSSGAPGRGSKNFFDETALQVGDFGKAVTALSPGGRVSVRNVEYEMISLEGDIQSGTEVQVVLMEDGKVYVKPVSDEF